MYHNNKLQEKHKLILRGWKFITSFCGEISCLNTHAKCFILHYLYENQFKQTIVLLDIVKLKIEIKKSKGILLNEHRFLI